MKILQINKFTFIRSGAERAMFSTRDLLIKNGHQVVIWGTNHPKTDQSLDVSDFPEYLDLSKREGFLKDFKKLGRIFWNREAAGKLERVIKKEKPDIAHLHNVFGHLSASVIFVLKKYHIPVVLTLHDSKLFCPNYEFYTHNEVCYRCLQKKSFWPCFIRKCIKNSRLQSLIGTLESIWNVKVLRVQNMVDLFISPSEFLKEKAIEAGIKPEKVVCLPNFSSVATTQENDSSFEGKYFLFSGRLSSEKGVDLLVKSFLEISSQAPDWKLKIAGDGPEKEKLQEQTKNCPQVEFLGWLDAKQLQKVTADSSLVIVPSIHPENLPYAVIEGFALGKAVLSSNLGGLPDMVKDGQTGLLFDPEGDGELAQKMLWAAKHCEEIKRMGDSAQREFMEKYTPEAHYGKLMEIYGRLVSEND